MYREYIAKTKSIENRIELREIETKLLLVFVGQKNVKIK